MRAKYGISTVCYLEKDNKVLFLQFEKKWGQIFCAPGGKMVEGESPLECIIREFQEETGLTLIDPVFKGYSHWNWIDKEYGIIFFYYATNFKGELKESVEGKLSWVNKDEIKNLRQFDMNTKFNDLIFEEGTFEGNFKLNEDDTVREYTLTKFKSDAKMLNEELNVKMFNDLNATEYLSLIDSIGWKKLTVEQVEKAIKNSMYVVKAVVNNETVGMGRLVGDFGCHAMLTDIVINPNYQRKGIGTKKVLNIKEYLTNYVKEGERFIIELCPTTGHRDFYINCGFKYKPENMDGMYLWIEK